MSRLKLYVVVVGTILVMSVSSVYLGNRIHQSGESLREFDRLVSERKLKRELERSIRSAELSVGSMQALETCDVTDDESGDGDAVPTGRSVEVSTQ